VKFTYFGGVEVFLDFENLVRDSKEEASNPISLIKAAARSGTNS
jgi:hypothetical protein